MADLTFDSVSKTYPGRVRAVRSLDLEIRNGELLVLLGPSGCGKSSILRMVAGLESVSSGEIRIGGRLINGLPPKERDVAMVFQDFALYPHMTVRQNLAFGLRMVGLQKAVVEWKVHDVAEMLGLSDLLDRKPGRLSGGQQQRVAVGRALVREPKCFLLDEPLSNVDARLRARMRGEIKALQKRQRATMVYVTHDQEEAMALGDRIAVIGNGRLQQVDVPLEIYHRPANGFVASCLGSPPINLVEGTYTRNGRESRFDAPDGLSVPLPTNDETVDRFEAVLAIRPEALVPAGPGSIAFGDDRMEIDLKIALCDPIGDRTDVHAQATDGTPFMARVNGSARLVPGKVTRFAINPKGLHLFEPGTYGKRFGER